MKKLSEKEQTIHQQFQTYGRNAREWIRKCQMLLPLIEKYQIWKKRNFPSVYAYAYQLAGMNKRQVREALRIMKHVEDKPALKRVVEEYGINRVKPVVSVATEETAEFWAEKSQEMSKNTLETYVREWKKEYQENEKLEQSTELQGKMLPRKQNQDQCTDGEQDRESVFEEISIQLPARIAVKFNKLKKNKTFIKNLTKMVEEFNEQPAAVHTESRHIPMTIRRYVTKRAGNTCEFPGCGKPHEILHHTQRWELEKVHDPDLIRALCGNHERIAHHGLIDNEDEPPEKWRLREMPDITDPKRYVDMLVGTHR